MLSNIINQIQQERDQDRHLSKKTGTNQIHDFTRIPGHRKVGPNIVFGKVPAASAFTPPNASAPRTTRAPEPEPEPESPPITTESINIPISEPTPVEVKQPPTRMTKTAMKKKQKEEQMAKKREALAKAQAEAPAPIEIESTVSE